MLPRCYYGITGVVRFDIVIFVIIFTLTNDMVRQEREQEHEQPKKLKSVTVVAVISPSPQSTKDQSPQATTLIVKWNLTCDLHLCSMIMYDHDMTRCMTRHRPCHWSAFSKYKMPNLVTRKNLEIVGLLRWGLCITLFCQIRDQTDPIIFEWSLLFVVCHKVVTYFTSQISADRNIFRIEWHHTVIWHFSESSH